MAFDWYPFYAADYRRDTLHLTLAEDAAYRRLIDEYMMRCAAPPDNDLALARIIGVPLEEWLTVSAVVRPFFKAHNGKLVNGRCEDELSAQAMRTQCKRIQTQKAAMIGWEKRRFRNALHADAVREQSGSITEAMRNDATLHYTKKESSSYVHGETPKEVAEEARKKSVATPGLTAIIQRGTR